MYRDGAIFDRYIFCRFLRKFELWESFYLFCCCYLLFHAFTFQLILIVANSIDNGLSWFTLILYSLRHDDFLYILCVTHYVCIYSLGFETRIKLRFVDEINFKQKSNISIHPDVLKINSSFECFVFIPASLLQKIFLFEIFHQNLSCHRVSYFRFVCKIHNFTKAWKCKKGYNEVQRNTVSPFCLSK